MQNEQEIATFITDKVRAAQRISGANLGFALSPHVPDFRQKFGTLRGFVEKFCQNTVGIIPPTKNTDVYFVPASMLSTMPVEGSKPPEPRDSAWRAFTSPSSQCSLSINTETGDFRIRLTSDSEPSPPWVALPSASPNDHRRIASEFLAEMAPEDRSTFEEIVKSQDFWPPWAAKMRTFEQGKYSRTWPLFRFKKLCNLYLHKLKSIGVGEELAAESLRRLKALKSAGRKAEQTAALKSTATLPPTLSIRWLATAALEAMSEGELRRVWLPLGPVADALGKNHSQ